MRQGVLRIALLIATSCWASVGWPAPARAAEEKPNGVTMLHTLLDAVWEKDLEDDPRAATQLGDSRFNALWADHSASAWAQRNRLYATMLDAASRIDAQQLPPAEQLNRELFIRLLRNRLDQYRFNAQLRALDQLNYSNGILTASETAEVINFATTRDYEDWIARLAGMGRYVDQTIALLREGIKQKNTQPRVIVDRVAKQLQAQLVGDPTRSPFYAPFNRFADAVAAEDRQRLAGAAQEAIRTTVVPAFERLQTFVNKEYLSASRATVGIWDTPNGADFYRNRVEWFTTTHLSPQEIHAIGLKEVDRIHAQMLKIIAQVGFNGSFAEFLTQLRTDPKFRYSSSDELLRLAVGG